MAQTNSERFLPSLFVFKNFFSPPLPFFTLFSLAPPNDHSRSTGITTTKILLPIPLSFLSIELRNFQLFSTQVTSLSLSPRPCLRAIFPTSSYFYKLRDPIFAFPPCGTSPRFRLSDFSPLSLVGQRKESRRKREAVKRCGTQQCGRCCSREDSHAETRYSPSASPVLSGDCVYTGRDAASFVPDRYEWTHHSHPWLSGRLSVACVGHANRVCMYI